MNYWNELLAKNIITLKLPVYWRKSFLKKICVPVMLDKWERVHGVFMMPLLILKAAADMSWNWTMRGLAASHHGSTNGSSMDDVVVVDVTPVWLLVIRVGE
jgi:hypothetical protein